MLKMSKLGISLALALTANSQLQAADAAPQVKAPDGAVTGTSFDGGEVYYNMPFARPPIGQLRWRAPQPITRQAANIDGRVPGAACMQPDQGWNAVDAARQSEDCLYLNVWRPDGAKDLPVMVWFHGGAFTGGAGNTPLYEGQALARAGVVLVTVNYRLGVLGFLAHPELSAESQNGVSGNYGLLDQIAALQWVRDNIEAFGGDKQNVTIFGQSAGAASVGFLLAAPQAKGLFNQAILQSGAPYGKVLGRTPFLGEAQAANRAFGSIAVLREVPADELLARWDKFSGVSGTEGLRLSPIIDGFVLPRQPADVFAQGRLKGRSVLVGNNAREFPANMDDEQSSNLAQEAFGAGASAALGNYAARADKVVRGSVADQLMTDLMFGCGSLQLAGVVGHAWLYEFAQPSPGEPMVRHSSELPYVFGNANKDGGVLSTRPFNAAEARLSETVIHYWTNFARTGNPNSGDLTFWPAFSAAKRVGVRFQNSEARSGKIGSGACRAIRRPRP